MKMSKAMLLTGMSLALLLSACRSRQEAAGDKFRKGGDPINALVQYEEALKRGKVSREFGKNYTQVNIQCLALRSKEDPTAEFLNPLKDTIASLLRQYPDAQNEGLFAQALHSVGVQRLNAGDDEGGIVFLAEADRLSNKPAEVSSAVAAARKTFVANKLKEIESDYKESLGDADSPAGIVADYKMNKLEIIFGKELPEMKELWSKIRKANLNTYLFYDREGLLSEPADARINRWGVVLAIVKSEVGATALKAQLKAFNGGSGPIVLKAENFTLVDREGKSYAATSPLGAIGKKDPINMREESKTGGVTFKYPAGTEPYYIEYKGDNGTSRKYLP